MIKDELPRPRKVDAEILLGSLLSYETSDDILAQLTQFASLECSVAYLLK